MPGPQNEPLRFESVLDEERAHLRKADGEPSSALCLSGGGVRSASFSLGVLQALSRAGVLDKFDYLSTVSGGGYTGGWLSAWRLRARAAGLPDPCTTLDGLSPGGDEPRSIAQLRAYIKYLTPHTGILSADVWTLVGTILRNLLVNWLLLVPAIAAAAMLPRLYLGIAGLPSQPEIASLATLEAWYQSDWILITVLLAIAGTYAALQLPSLGRRAYGLPSFIGWFLIPVLAVHVIFSIHRFWAPQFKDHVDLIPAMLMSAAGMVLPWVVGGLLGGRFAQPTIWIAAAVAGAAGRFAAWHVHRVSTIFAQHHPDAFVVLDLSVSLLMLFLQMALFIGLASRAMSDDDREWWARSAAWVLISSFAWAAVSGIVILGPVALNWLLAQIHLSHGAGRVGLTLATIVAGVAHRATAAWAVIHANSRSLKLLVTPLVAPLITASLFVLTSDFNAFLLKTIDSRHWLQESVHVVGESLPEDVLAFSLLALLALALGRVVAVNRFSLHGMYRFRLVRTFLGASRPPEERRPSPFTGFDADDDLRMAELASLPRPLHVVNATLNTVDNTSLATADRQARSFTFSALHAGSAGVGYRPSDRYADGFTLGEAITTSGAAVNSNMGAAASRTETFLLTVFNARLGLWIGNPGTPGDRSWMRPVPSFGMMPLLNELTARTTDKNPYVNLSDGGHFDNLGVYEMIRRRCRTIVAIDSGADPDYHFGDLATLIRRVRIDFGVAITFPSGLHIAPHAAGERSRWAVGTISYRDVDPNAENGVLLYVKPTMLGDEPIDVANYARSHAPFPHQSTTNQWFDEAEFESYRALGWHTIASLCGDRACSNPRDLFEDATPSGA